MSTNDVPGAVAANRDVLAIGCWAEATDGSLIFVEANENGRVIFSVFDVSKGAPTEYRTAMPEQTFKDTFSWKGGKGNGGKGNGGSVDKWTWHDKTPFDWDRVIKAGVPEGEKAAFASDQLSAAARVAESLRSLGDDVNERPVGDRYDHRGAREITSRDVAGWIADRITGAIDRMSKR